MSVVFVAYVKRWMHDGKGLLASKSVSVLHCSPHGLCRYLIQTVLVMLELKWGQQKKNYHYCPQNSIVDGVLTSQMLRINLLWKYFRLPGACIKFLINHTKTWYSFFTSYEGKNPDVPPGKYFYMAAYFTVCIFFSIRNLGFFYLQYLIVVSCLCWTCSHHLWTWSLW